MANKTNRKPGDLVNQNTKKDVAMAMKRRESNLNHTKFTKFVFILMILAFVAFPVAQLISYLIG